MLNWCGDSMAVDIYNSLLLQSRTNTKELSGMIRDLGPIRIKRKVSC